jgi:hypothetical protein
LPIPSGVESAYIGVYGMFTGDVYDIWLEWGGINENNLYWFWFSMLSY